MSIEFLSLAQKGFRLLLGTIQGTFPEGAAWGLTPSNGYQYSMPSFETNGL